MTTDFHTPAVFSPDRVHRYLLRRPLGLGGRGICLFIRLNPSKADEERNDPTTTRDIGFATRWVFEV